MVTVHRELIRNLQHWRALYEADEAPDVLTAGDDVEYCLWDVEKFYAARSSLPERQQMTIQMNLYEDRSEKDCAKAMGIGLNNPVAMYGTVGLTRLLAKAVSGEIEGYFVPIPSECSAMTGVYVSKKATRSAKPKPQPQPAPPEPEEIPEPTEVPTPVMKTPGIVIDRVTTTTQFVTYRAKATPEVADALGLTPPMPIGPDPRPAPPRPAPGSIEAAIRFVNFDPRKRRAS